MKIGPFTIARTKSSATALPVFSHLEKGDAWIDNVLEDYQWLGRSLVTISGVATPRHSPYLLAALFGSNGYHSAALHWKRAATVGQGYECSDALQAWLDTACAHDDEGFQGILKRTSLDLETHANMYVEIGMDQYGASLWWCPAIKTRVKPPKVADGDESFIQYEYQVGTRGYMEVDFPRFRPGFRNGIRQLKLENIFGDSWYGGVPYESVIELLRLNCSIVKLAKTFFDNGFVFDQLFTVTGGTLDEKDKVAIRTFLAKNHQGVDNAHKALLLTLKGNAKLEVKDMNSLPKESSFSELRQTNRDEIATRHLVPRPLLNIAGEKSLGSITEMATAVDIFKVGFANDRQLTLERWWKSVLKDCGAPDTDTLKFRTIDTSNDLTFAQTLSMLTGNQPIIAPNEARAEWEQTKSIGKLKTPFSPSEALRFTKILKWIEEGKERL